MILLPSATACNAAANLNLIFLPDSLSGKNFLADSGASLSILPHKSPNCPSGPKLKSINGATISAWGFKTLPVKISLFIFVHRFLLADVANPILGIDFFKQHGLVISPPTHQAVFSSTGVPLWPANQVSAPPPPPRRSQPPAVSNQPANQVTSVPSLPPVPEAAFITPAHQVSSSLPPPRPPAGTTAAAFSQVSSASPAPPPSPGNIDPRVQQLLQEFPEVCQQPARPPRPSHGVEHVIELQVGQSLPSPAAWTLTSSRWLRMSLPSWKLQVSSEGQTAPGRLHSTWKGKRTGLAALQRQSLPHQHHQPRQVSIAQHARPQQPPGRMQGLQQA